VKLISNHLCDVIIQHLCLLCVVLVLMLQSTVVSALQLEKDEMETKVGQM
jgi:hypothetical protein